MRPPSRMKPPSRMTRSPFMSTSRERRQRQEMAHRRRRRRSSVLALTVLVLALVAVLVVAQRVYNDTRPLPHTRARAHHTAPALLVTQLSPAPTAAGVVGVSS